MVNRFDNCAWQNFGGNYIKPGGCNAPDAWNSSGLPAPDGDLMPSVSPSGDIFGDQGYGIIDAFGCPLVDIDGDGMPNGGVKTSGGGVAGDHCPNEGPTDEWGMTREGCPILDSDGDRVPDTQDPCPNDFGSRSNAGCPAP